MKLVETLYGKEALDFIREKMNRTSDIFVTVEHVGINDSFWTYIHTYSNDFASKVKPLDIVIKEYEKYMDDNDDGGDDAEDDRYILENIINDISLTSFYYKPVYGDVDPEIAVKVGLIPFRMTTDDYREVYVALGVSGIDASPKLDAYQSFIEGTIPSDSKLITDEGYFRYIVGDNITEEVKNRIKLGKEKIKVEIY